MFWTGQKPGIGFLSFLTGPWNERTWPTQHDDKKMMALIILQRRILEKHTNRLLIIFGKKERELVGPLLPKINYFRPIFFQFL